MLNRRTFAAALVAVVAAPTLAFAQARTPSGMQIERQLDAAPRMRLKQSQRVTVQEFKRRPDLRRAAPSIDIQSINFAFGSLFGFTGMLVAVPAAAAVGVLVRFALNSYLHSPLYDPAFRRHDHETGPLIEAGEDTGKEK